jgi:endonuclease III related protein
MQPKPRRSRGRGRPLSKESPLSAGGEGVGGGVELLLQVHERLLAHHDIDRWHWTPDTPAFDVCVGCILVQHTAWTNVEKAIANLKTAGIDTIEAVMALDAIALTALISPSGTPAVKARRLRAFGDLVLTHGGFEGLFDRPAEELRALLLATHGIGPETADAICLYAAHLPVVVHDAYTDRLCRRLGIGPEGKSYETWRAWLHATLPDDLEFRYRNHAAIVVHCKETCRVKPKCSSCPLADLCAFAQAAQVGGA